MAIADAEELRANNGKNAEAVLKHVPQDALIGKDDLIEICQRKGIGKHLSPKLIAQLLEDGTLTEYRVPRPNVKPKVLLGRQKLNLNPNLSLDAYAQNSQGHYIIPQNPVKTL